MLKSLEVYERMNLCDALVPKSFPNGSIIIKEVGALSNFDEINSASCNSQIFGHLNSRNSVLFRLYSRLSDPRLAVGLNERSKSHALEPERGTDLAEFIIALKSLTQTILHSFEFRATKLMECTSSNWELLK